MDQLQMEPRARKKKKSSKLEFDASQVFGTSKDTEIQMDLDSGLYAAQKGQGAARRAEFSPRVSSPLGQPSSSIRPLYHESLTSACSSAADRTFDTRL